jgi:hypothetical protein
VSARKEEKGMEIVKLSHKERFPVWWQEGE